MKHAAAEDGPSLELQFGTMANAVIADKYPKLDKCKLAFQLIEKEDDNSKAMGAAVYMIGKSVVFVPAFYKNGKINTGDMMFLAKEQQFLPLSDPWLAWVQDKELKQPGSVVEDPEAAGMPENRPMTIREVADPIIKTACLYLKGLLRLSPDYITKTAAEYNVFDTVAGMGKTAAEGMLDNLIGNRGFLNAALQFYSGDQLDAFAKTAAEMGRETEEVTVVLPFTKEAKGLTPDEKAILDRDGYIIKKASEENLPTVIKSRNVGDSFKLVSDPGKLQLLSMDGTVHPCLVMRTGHISFWDLQHNDDSCRAHRMAEPTYDMPTMNASKAMHCTKHEDGGLCAIVTQGAKSPQELPSDTMMLASGENKDFKPEMLKDYGKAMTPANVPKIDYGWLLCPDGRAYRMQGVSYARDKDWYSTDNFSVVVGEADGQKSPILTHSMCIVPKGSRYLDNGESSYAPVDDYQKQEKEEIKGRHYLAFVTWRTFETFLKAYEEKNFKKLRVTSNGSEAYVSGDRSDGKPMSVKEASLHLVRDYGIEPGVARHMMQECMAGASASSVKSELYLLTKTAADPDWQDAGLARHEFTNIGDRRDYRQMPSILEDPAQLQQAIQVAAENGIKEVFDVTAFKLLLRQNRFLEEIHDDLPMFMRVLDSLCRKLFLLYWHTEDFEDQYGTVKLKSLEDSLKTTLDSLSELTIFFKLRTVDGDPGIGQDGGDLMQGHDI